MEVTALKKVLAISCLVVVFTITMAAMASAADNNWRFYLKADNGAGSDAWQAMTIGVYSTSTLVSKDGNYSDSLGSDMQDGRFVTGVGMPTARAAAGVFKETYPDTSVGDMAWTKDIKSPRAPWEPIYSDGRKVWDLRVAGMGAAADGPIRLLFTTIGATVLPPPTVSGKAVQYWLKMVDNKGMEGAYANNTIWSIPIPTVHSTTIPYFTLTLPLLNISAFTEGTFINEGYKMEFYQTPEPSSLMALGAGLMALGGLASRRRRK